MVVTEQWPQGVFGGKVRLVVARRALQGFGGEGDPRAKTRRLRCGPTRTAAKRVEHSAETSTVGTGLRKEGQIGAKLQHAGDFEVAQSQSAIEFQPDPPPPRDTLPLPLSLALAVVACLLRYPAVGCYVGARS